MVELKHRVISTFLNSNCTGLRDLSVCPRRTIGDNDFHVLILTCAEIIMMKEKVIVFLK